MDIKAYVYIESYDGIMCFECAVKEIIALETSDTETGFDLALEMGDTGFGNDMRSTPYCVRCGKVMIDHYIA